MKAHCITKRWQHVLPNRGWPQFIRRSTLAIALMLTFDGGLPQVANAATTITVTTTIDEVVANTQCSLREAILSANTNTAVGGCPAGSGTDTIVLPAGTYPLTIQNGFGGTDNAAEDDLDITDTLTLTGAGADLTIIDADALTSGVMKIIGTTVIISGVRLRNGDAFVGGGGIFVRGGELTLSNSVVTNNAADDRGGGIFVDYAGTVRLTNSTISYNVSENGGGVFVEQGGRSFLTRARIHNNTATEQFGEWPAAGGGLSNEGTTDLIDSTIDGNKAQRQGGGVSNKGTLFVSGSTISNNTTNVSGAGLANHAEPAGVSTLVNSTISGNRARLDGGGVWNEDLCETCSNTVYLNNVTIAFNQADSNVNGTGDGGGVANRGFDAGARIRFWNTIVANNSDSGKQGPDCVGTLFSYGYNLIGNTKLCAFRGTTRSNKTNIDPRLGLLNSNGGPTKTHALLSSSPALGAGNPETPAPLGGTYACALTDQRGVSRPQSGGGVANRCDIGAVERKPSTSSSGPVEQEALLNGTAAEVEARPLTIPAIDDTSVPED